LRFQIKLAISYALAQSTKLSLHERRVTDMVLETKHLPESLARSGKVTLSPDRIAKLIGKVFIQKVRPEADACVEADTVVAIRVCGMQWDQKQEGAAARAERGPGWP
jgi:hypothetical protein